MLKKITIAIFSSLILMLLMGFAASASDEIKLYLNGNEIPKLEENHQFAHVENGAVYLPLRNIFEAMGALVEWDGENEVITSRGVINFTVYVGQNLMILTDMNRSNDEILLKITTKIVDGRTFVGKDVVENVMGATVNFDENSNSVFIIFDVHHGMVIDFGNLAPSFDDEE